MPAWCAATPRWSPSSLSQIFVAQHPRPRLDDAADLIAIGRFGEPDAGAEHLTYGLVAPGAREDEHDGREQVLPVQQFDDLRTLDAPVALRLLMEPAPVASTAPAGRSRRDRPATRPCEALQFGIDAIRRRLT
jgi:hypothetical protein